MGEWITDVDINVRTAYDEDEEERLDEERVQKAKEDREAAEEEYAEIVEKHLKNLFGPPEDEPDEVDVEVDITYEE